MQGQILGRFNILEEIGKGGMGVVYKAHDARLDRHVALKIIRPDQFANDERRQRFEQEARAASALHHPNIVTVHDIARDGDRDVIVMEYVSGRTLDQLIKKSGLTLKQALDYAIQIADGLSSAHVAGIVHRDLKPSNIMVTDDGTVKILDFGLAKLFESESAGPTNAAAPSATTHLLPDGLTGDGHIVGTAAYMSPEQAEGKKVDSRSDVFSFGACLYEMVTGRRAFQRDTPARTLTAIVGEEPDPADRVRADVPPELVRAIERCLRKEPHRRWQNLSDLRIVLQDLKDDSESGRLRGIAALSRSRTRWGWWAAAAAGATGIAAAVMWMILNRPPPPSSGISVTRMTLDAAATIWPTISPDGRFLAYASDRAQPGNYDIWVQQVSGGQPLRLTDDPATDGQPSFSPDGSHIAFSSQRDGGGIYLVNTLGTEQARRIADHGFFPEISPDGSQIVYVDIPASLDSGMNRIRLVSAGGGPSREFHPEFSVWSAVISSHPIWSPDGSSLLFLGIRDRDMSTADWWVAPLGGGPPKRLGAITELPLKLPWGLPRAWTTNFVYYVQGTTVQGVNIFRVPFDSARLTFTGKPEQLTTGAGMKWNVALSRDGRLVYSQTTWVQNVWSVAALPDQGRVTGEPEQISRDETAKFSPRVSRDGSTLAYSAFSGLDPSGSELRLRVLATGHETPIASTADLLDQAPVLNADGSLVAYREVREGRGVISLHAAGSVADREFCQGCTIRAFFSDSRTALAQYEPRQLVRQSVSTGERAPVLSFDDATILDASLSADDRWLAYLLALPNGRAAIEVAPLGTMPVPADRRTPIREDDHVLSSPRWSPNGSWLYYVSATDGFMCVWGQRLDPVTRRPVGPPVAMLHAHGSRQMSFPIGRMPLEVVSDKFVLLLSETKGNLYTARLARW